MRPARDLLGGIRSCLVVVAEGGDLPAAGPDDDTGCQQCGTPQLGPAIDVARRPGWTAEPVAVTPKRTARVRWDASLRKAVVMESTETPAGLLYLLTVGKEKELVLQLHGPMPTIDEISGWMREATVRALTLSRHGDEQPSTLVVNFGHVVGARIAPYSDARSGSF